MFVSKRVLFFKSKRNGWMLFCGNSNSFYQIEDENVPVVQKMFDTGDENVLPAGIRKEFVKSGVLLHESDEEFFKRMKYYSMKLRFQQNQLSLTIAPTMACNFKCVYCYEGNRINNKLMRDEVVNSIVDFIKNGDFKNVSVTWYGGEPLCAWKKILDFNKKIEALELENLSQSIVTNGSLLDVEKINFFFEKKFSNIQITLDGTEKTHNNSRPMKNGGNSYKTIMKNLETIYDLYRKEGKRLPIIIRVNITDNNSQDYPILYDYISQKFNNYYSIYPAFVTKSEDNDCHTSSCLTFEKEADYILKLSNKNHIMTNKLFPEGNKFIACGAQLLNNYVVSTEGDLYKCWEDISNKEKCIGNIRTGCKDIYNLNYQFILDSSGFENEDCKECLFLYSCMGGCPRFRLNNYMAGKEINPVCSVIKNKPKEFLESYYELKKNKFRC